MKMNKQLNFCNVKQNTTIMISVLISGCKDPLYVRYVVNLQFDIVINYNYLYFFLKLIFFICISHDEDSP